MSAETANEITTEAYGILAQVASNPDFDTRAMFEKLDGEKVSGSFDIKFGSETSCELKIDLSDDTYERSATITENVVAGDRKVHVFVCTRSRKEEDWMAGWVATGEEPTVRMMPGFIDYIALAAELGKPDDLTNPFITMGLGSFPELVLDFRNTVNSIIGDGIDK